MHSTRRVQIMRAIGENLPSGVTRMLLNAFKKDIINQLAAAAEKRILNNPLAPYFRAFTGAFDPRMPFTVYFEMKNKPVLFVFDAKPNEERSRRAVFVEHCERICENMQRITDVIQDFTDGGYLSVDSPESNTRPPLPPNWDCCWRKYTHLSPYLIEGLAFVCYSRLTPTEKLNPPVPVG